MRPAIWNARCYWRRIFSLTGKTRLVCGALCRSVISIADAGFCRRQFQQTQGSPVSCAWLKCNSGAWEIHKSKIMLQYSKSLFFAQVCCTSFCARSLALSLAHKYTLGLNPHGMGARIGSKLPTAFIFCRYLLIFECLNVKEDIAWNEFEFPLTKQNKNKNKQKKVILFWGGLAKNIVSYTVAYIILS